MSAFLGANNSSSGSSKMFNEPLELKLSNNDDNDMHHLENCQGRE